MFIAIAIYVFMCPNNISIYAFIPTKLNENTYIQI